MTTTPAILSLQIGLPAIHGADNLSKREWSSGIFKAPVEGRVWLDTLNLAGDGQDDLDNHGGPFRAVLAYAAAHYPVWREELNRPDLAYGSFGENFTVSVLTEDTVCLGDVYTVGEAVLRVAQPRSPCWKLARRNGIKDLTARVEKRGWGGWYHQVLQTGYVQAGDALVLAERPYPHYTIAYLNDLMSERITDPGAYRALGMIEILSPGWRDYFARLGARAG